MGRGGKTEEDVLLRYTGFLDTVAGLLTAWRKMEGVGGGKRRLGGRGRDGVSFVATPFSQRQSHVWVMRYDYPKDVNKVTSPSLNSIYIWYIAILVFPFSICFKTLFHGLFLCCIFPSLFVPYHRHQVLFLLHVLFLCLLFPSTFCVLNLIGLFMQTDITQKAVLYQLPLFCDDCAFLN